MSYAYDNADFSHYYDTFVANLPSDAFWIDTVSTVYAEIIQRTSVDNQPTIVVDLGCGTGEDLLCMENRFKDKNIQLIGVDHSQAMLDRAREKLSKQSIHSIELVHASLTDFVGALGTKVVDCILLPAGTFHHLITDQERQDMISNIQQVLRPKTGLFAIYLMPDSFIHVDATHDAEKQEKMKVVSTENVQQTDQEWVCKQVFEFNAPVKTELSWQLRTCIMPNLLASFRARGLEPVLCCVNGKVLIAFDEKTSSSLSDFSTPVILVFRKIENTN